MTILRVWRAEPDLVLTVAELVDRTDVPEGTVRDVLRRLEARPGWVERKTYRVVRPQRWGLSDVGKRELPGHLNPPSSAGQPPAAPTGPASSPTSSPERTR